MKEEANVNNCRRTHVETFKQLLAAQEVFEIALIYARWKENIISKCNNCFTIYGELN